MTLLQCRRARVPGRPAGVEPTFAAWLRGACSDPEGPRLAPGSALPDAICEIGPGINQSRF
jgi:hypothetical protein